MPPKVRVSAYQSHYLSAAARSVHHIDRDSHQRTPIPHRWSTIMTDKKNDAGGTQDARGDSEDALQEELRREAAERKNAIGDVDSNKNLSGSTTWETLPEDDSSPSDNT